MKRLIVLVLIILSVGFLFLRQSPKREIAHVVTPTATPTPSPFSEDKLWSLIQKWRTDNGFQPYIKDQRLCAIAEDRVTNDPILDNHEGLYRRYSNYPYVIQENLAKAPGEAQMLSDWIHSPGHLATLQKPYKYSCIACKSLPKIYVKEAYCSQIFSNL